LEDLSGSQGAGFVSFGVGQMVEQARADQGKSTRGTLTIEEKEELSRLRKENREMRLEREIFKKAAAFFAKEHR
jgi:transposase